MAVARTLPVAVALLALTAGCGDLGADSRPTYDVPERTATVGSAADDIRSSRGTDGTPTPPHTPIRQGPAGNAEDGTGDGDGAGRVDRAENGTGAGEARRPCDGEDPTGNLGRTPDGGPDSGPSDTRPGLDGRAFDVVHPDYRPPAPACLS